MNEADVRNYTLYLKGSINTYQAAIRTMNYLQMPRLKEDKALLEILSREEIAQLLEYCENPKHKAIFALAYGSGLWVSEICTLRIQDIDSKQMRVFVRNSKRNKDRYTILSQQCLEFLRTIGGAFGQSTQKDCCFQGGEI